jgi:pimeloyl-ACP methyl ester carboxylesterase
MRTELNIKDQIKLVVAEQCTTDFVTSKDGTTIGYYKIGHGPGLVLVQGAMGTARDFMQLAESLADTFTVYLPDRRGRGLNNIPYSKDYTVRKDVEDLEAIFAKTGACYLFGLSAGALISLRATLTLPAVRKAVLYEPPLFVSGLPTALMARYEKEITQGKIAAALITAMQATQMGPAVFNVMPRWLLELLTARMMESQDKAAKPGDVTMRMLAPTLRFDFQVVSEMNGTLASFKDLHTDVLLLGGSQSPAFLKADLDALEKVLPKVKRVEFPNLGHAAAWNYDKHRNPTGNPKLVAHELKRFFA